MNFFEVFGWEEKGREKRGREGVTHSSALLDGSLKNIVHCSPGLSLKRCCGCNRPKRTQYYTVIHTHTHRYNTQTDTRPANREIHDAPCRRAHTCVYTYAPLHVCIHSPTHGNHKQEACRLTRDRLANTRVHPFSHAPEPQTHRNHEREAHHLTHSRLANTRVHPFSHAPEPRTNQHHEREACRLTHAWQVGDSHACTALLTRTGTTN